MNGRSTAPFLVEGDEQPFLGAGNLRDGRGLADHVFLQDGGLVGLAGGLVVVFQRHDQHGVGVFAELHQVGHPADHPAVGGLAEGRLVDRAVGADESVVRPVEVAASLLAMGLGPAVVLREQHAPGVVAEAHQGGQPFAGEVSVGSQGRAAVGDRHGLPIDALANGAIGADEEAAFADVAQGRRRVEGNGRRCGSGCVLVGAGSIGDVGQLPDGGPQLLGQVAVRRQRCSRRRRAVFWRDQLPKTISGWRMK